MKKKKLFWLNALEMACYLSKKTLRLLEIKNLHQEFRGQEPPPSIYN